MATLTVKWRVSPESKPYEEFRGALLWAYRYAWQASRGDDVHLEIPLHEAGLTSWTVAHRRMLLRVLLGLEVPRWALAPLQNSLHSERARLGCLPQLQDAYRALGPGLGALREGSALLVGDRPGAGWSGQLNWPFVSGHRGGCSAWLADRLEEGGVPESRLYWINATTQTGAPTEPHFLSRLRPSVVVALGKNAATWIGEYVDGVWNVELHQVHHPQSWKRFHSKDRYHLIKLLRRGLGIHVRGR